MSNKLLWTREMVMFLRENYLDMTDIQLSVGIRREFYIDVTDSQVGQKRGQLGLNRGPIDHKTKYWIKLPKRGVLTINKKVKFQYRYVRAVVNYFEIYIVYLCQKPHLCAISESLETALITMSKRVRKYLAENYMHNMITVEKAERIRADYQAGMSVPRLANKYGVKRNSIRNIVGNKTYVSTRAGFTAKKDKTPQINIFGETKTLLEWLRDPRCEVSHATLRLRYKQGIRGEELLKRKHRVNVDESSDSNELLT